MAHRSDKRKMLKVSASRYCVYESEYWLGAGMEQQTELRKRVRIAGGKT